MVDEIYNFNYPTISLKKQILNKTESMWSKAFWLRNKRNIQWHLIYTPFYKKLLKYKKKSFKEIQTSLKKNQRLKLDFLYI